LNMINSDEAGRVFKKILENLEWFFEIN
jgi:hypothetical protein